MTSVVGVAPKRLLSTRRLSLAFVMLVVAALIAMLVYGVSKKGTYAGLQLSGKPAPDFALELFDGGTLTLSSLQGRPVVINFWASWCLPCREEAPTLEKAWRDNKDKGLVLIGIDVQDRDEDARAFIKEFGVTYPNGPDSTNRISVSYGLTGVPETVFISKDGLVVRKHLGALNSRQMRTYIEEIMR